MQEISDINRILDATINKPVDSAFMRKEVLLVATLRSIMKKYPVQYAMKVCKSSDEAETLLTNLLKDKTTTIEYLQSDLNSYLAIE